MRAWAGLIAVAWLAGSASMLLADPAGAQCSVFDRHPCMPTNCSVFQRRPCIPETQYPIGQDLQLTIETNPEPAKTPVNSNDSNGDEALPSPVSATGGTTPEPDASAPPAEHKVDTIRELFSALRSCWVPPSESEARAGMQMSVRFSFKRTGEIIGTPRVTYTSPDAPRETRDLYHDAIAAALERCTPMPFSAGLGGAVAGRPIAIRFVDNRKTQ